MHKLKKKQIAAVIILCVNLVASMFFYPSCTADTSKIPEIIESAEPIYSSETAELSETPETTKEIETTEISELQAKPKPLVKYYDYSSDFSDKQGPVWYYLSVPAGGVIYNQLEYVETPWNYSAWATAGKYLFEIGFITQYEMIPGFNHDSVIAFKAPYTGTVILSSDSDEVRLKDSTGVKDGSVPSDGAEFGVFLYGAESLTKLYPKGDGTLNSGMEFFENGESKPFEPIEINVKKNEMIWIRANSGINGRNDHDSIFFQPVIKYTSIDENDSGIDETAKERTDRPAGSNLKADEFPMVEGKYDDDKIIRTDHFFITNETDKVLDFTGYKYIVNELFIIEDCYNVTIKNLTLELNGDMAIVSGENIIIDGVRLISTHEVTTIDYKEMKLGNSVKNAAIKNSYFSGMAIVDNTATGLWIENNIMEYNDSVIITLGSNGTMIYNNINSGVINSYKTENVLIALNKLSIKYMTVEQVKNGVILLNEIPSQIRVFNGTNITIAENTFIFENDTKSLINLENVNYALGTNNIFNGKFINPDNDLNMLIPSITNCQNLSGNDFTEYKLLDVGANEDLLPKLNKELFVGMERKTTVISGNKNNPALNNYIATQYNYNKYVIVPPGAYSTSPINLSGYSDYKIYAYGVLCEFDNYNTVVQMTDCENISIKGIYIDFTVPPNGQAVITNISNNKITFKMDAGYNQNLLDSNKYALNNGNSANIQWYKQSEKIVSNVATEKITEINAANGEFSLPKSAFKDAKVGDKFGFRGKDRFVTYFVGCSGMKLEDYTIYGGGGFGFMERNGDQSTIINRLAVVPGPAPVLSGGERGADRLMSTCDSTHSTNMRRGPQITNCLFESASDDGANINAEFGTVTDFDPNTRAVTYTQGNNFYSGLCVDFKIGDRVMIYTKNGELLCDSTAVSNTAANGNIRTVQIGQGEELTVKGNITVIQNASASGNGFSIKNTKLYGNWTKGFLIKAIGGEISNCTFDRVGITAVYLCPEIKDGHWNECGYSENILIKDNFITETGYMYSGEIYSTAINIRSDAGITSNPKYMMMKNITVAGNKIANRHTKYALNINGGNHILVENNDWGFMFGKTADNDKQASATIATSMDIELNGNIYPPLASPKISISKNSTVNINGTDSIIY